MTNLRHKLLIFFLAALFPVFLSAEFNKKTTLQWIEGTDAMMKEAGIKGIVKYKDDPTFKDASKEVIPLVQKAVIESRDEKVRIAAAYALGELNWKGTSVSLVEAYKKEGNSDKLNIAIGNALLKMKDPAAIEPLMEAMKDNVTSKVTEVRVVMTKVLGETKDIRAKTLLVELLGDIDDPVRIEAIKSMEKIKYDNGIYYVIDVVAVDNSPDVRMAALEYCKKYGNIKTLDELEMIKKAKHKKKFDEVMAKIPDAIKEIKKREKIK